VARRGAGAWLALLTLGLPLAARAQVAASVTLQSDYRYRGYTLTDRKAALALNLAYDHASGLYAGGTAFTADTTGYGPKVRGEVGYVGYAVRSGLGPTLDLGVSRSRFVSYRTRKHVAAFTEAYVGLAGDHLSARVAYSPKYLGQNVQTAYLDLGAVYRPAPNWRLFAHAGALVPLRQANPIGLHKRYDLSAGAARRIRACELSAFWTYISPDLVYANGRRAERNALVVSAAYFF
jgi:uncharacterized protein (TIGR02001 family)